MFDQAIVVKSAVSAFNNAALGAPLFFWIGVLMLPLFAMVWKCGNDFINGQSWWVGLRDGRRRAFNFGLGVSVLIFAWLIFMGGNYGVLRDATSTLPYVVSVLLFVLSAVIIQNLRTINPELPAFVARRVRHRRLFLYGMLALIAVAAGIGGMPTLWGFLMPAAAVFGGAVAGRALRRGPSAEMFVTLVMFTVATIMLMQPEFFRFGRLGGLTLIHLAAMFIVGAFAAATVALRVVSPRAKIHHSAFVKLKWMARFVAALGLVLFVLTESVPVFLGLVAVMVLSMAMSVWHAKSVPDDLGGKMWAAMMCAFGVITIMPVITAIGIVYWAGLKPGNAWRQAKFLL